LLSKEWAKAEGKTMIRKRAKVRRGAGEGFAGGSDTTYLRVGTRRGKPGIAD